MLALILHEKQIRSIAEDDGSSDPSTPTESQTPAITEDHPSLPVLPVVVPHFIRNALAHGRPGQIRLSLKPQHPPLPSSSTMLAD